MVWCRFGFTPTRPREAGCRLESSQQQAGTGELVHVRKVNIHRVLSPVLRLLKNRMTGAQSKGLGAMMAKLDVEGEEYNLLPALRESGNLCAFKHLTVEWHKAAAGSTEQARRLMLRREFESPQTLCENRTRVHTVDDEWLSEGLPLRTSCPVSNPSV